MTVHPDNDAAGHKFAVAVAEWFQQLSFKLRVLNWGDDEAVVGRRIEERAGHGAGKPTAKRIAKAADTWAFLVKVLGVDVPAK